MRQFASSPFHAGFSSLPKAAVRITQSTVNRMLIDARLFIVH
jgi:hypothetical protein